MDIPAPSVVSAATPCFVKKPRQALALGLGSMFNHRRNPNVAWERNIATQSIRYFALRDIDEEEELCISYGPKLWFNDADEPEGEVEVESETEILSCQVDVFE
jgi:SET domain-containing protein